MPLTPELFPFLRYFVAFPMLALATSSVSNARADISGFGNAGANFSLNGGVTVNNTVATLTDGGANEARSIFYGTAQPIAGFNVSFTYQETASVVATGEGFAFVVQTDSRQAQAVGGNGTSLGYGGGGGATAVSPSAAVQFNLLNVAGVTASSTGYATEGALTGNQYNLSASTNLGGGSPIQVNIHYNGATLTETLTNLSSGAVSPTYSYAAGNLSSLLGSNSAYIGFTGSTGSLPATQTISNFSFVSVPEPPLWGVAGGGVLALVSVARLRRLGLSGKLTVANHFPVIKSDPLEPSLNGSAVTAAADSPGNAQTEENLDVTGVRRFLHSENDMKVEGLRLNEVVHSF